MLGVRKPISPIEYALTSVCPMSSPQMITMLGILAAVVCVCAVAPPPASKKLEMAPRLMLLFVRLHQNPYDSPDQRYFSFVGTCEFLSQAHFTFSTLGAVHWPSRIAFSDQ
jgi:hypothetical protein